MISLSLSLSLLSLISLGKSNLLDAISFVLGVKTGALRGQQLFDLIYNHESDENIGGGGGEEKKHDVDRKGKLNAWVELVYFDSVGTEYHFRRSITHAGTSSYSVNDTKINHEQYILQLNKMGINIQAKNFLVFQVRIKYTNITQSFFLILYMLYLMHHYALLFIIIIFSASSFLLLLFFCYSLSLYYCCIFLSLLFL